MRFYKPEKYKILEGNDTGLAFCTCWMDPFSLIPKQEEMKTLFNITGTLYSKEGVSIVLRNLALNPQIRHLILWGNTPLSNTPFGIAGRQLLKTVWHEDIDSDDIHNEIDRNVIREIVQNVELIDVSDRAFDETLEFAKDDKFKKALGKYMDSTEFPEPKRDETKPLPSEGAGWVVRSKKLYNSWLWGIDRVMRYGHIKPTEYGNFQRELHNVNWIIEDESPDKVYKPELDTELMKVIGLDDISLKKYRESLLDPVIPKDTAYTYGSRLRNYKDCFDQVEFLIKKITEQSVSRRAMGTTVISQYDANQSSPPCLVYVQVLTDAKDRLNMFAVFRSNDFFKAGIPNAYGLLNLHKFISEGAGLERGVLSINSISAHIYEEDWDNAYKLLKCQRWEEVSTLYNENQDTDPRGIARVYANNSKIKLELVTLNGEVVYEDESSFGRDIIMRLARLNLLSRPDHYADICIEVVKADMSIQSGKEYQQDRVLDLGSVKIK